MKRAALPFVFLLGFFLIGPPAFAQEAGDSPGSYWWDDRVFYEVFVRSFYDSDGDGIGDLQGLIRKLDYLNDGDPSTTDDLGVTGIWLMPVTEAASYHGYDTVDYRQIERDYGANDDFKQLMDEAHKRGIAVIVDLVLNHTSSQHPWFTASQDGDPAYANWFIWTKTNPGYLGPWGQQVWHPAAGGRLYYGIFWSEMPDLNYNYPPVTEAMYDAARFWLEGMGADGFRLDAVRHLIEQGAIQGDTPATFAWLAKFDDYLDTVDPDALTVGEIWTSNAVVSRYTEQDAVDLAFNFDEAEATVWAVSHGDYRTMARAQAESLDAFPGQQYAAFLTNHDQPRVMTQLAGDVGAAKVAAALLLTNPGVPFLYYGEEIGMVGDKPDERIRTPMQWDATPGAAGFTTGTPWEPLADGYEAVNVAAQTGDPDSLLSHYRALIHLRAAHPALANGDFLPVDTGNFGVYSFARRMDGETLLVVVNLTAEPVRNYALALAEGPLAGETIATLLYGAGEIGAPAINGAGGFDAYTPLPELPARSTTVVLLGE